MKDSSVSKNKKDIDLSGEAMMRTIRRHQTNSCFALLKHMADCYKGEKASNLPKSHFTTSDGEFLYYKDSLNVVLENGVMNYDHKDIPGLVPLIIVGSKLELIQRPGFSQPPRGIYREIIRQLSEELKIEYKTIGPQLRLLLLG